MNAGMDWSAELKICFSCSNPVGNCGAIHSVDEFVLCTQIVLFFVKSQKIICFNFLGKQLLVF